MRLDDNPLRRILLAVLALSCIGTGAELLLLEHTEDVWQWAPIGLLAAGLLALAYRLAAPRPRALKLLRAVMGLCVLSGAVGVFLHYRGNTEFELEMMPSLAGLDLFRKSIQGATPALAPGAMVQIGLVGLAYCFRHPLLRKGRRDDDETDGDER